MTAVTARLPFVCQQESGSDSLAGAIPVAHNIVMEPTGAVRRRPGIVAYSDGPETSLDAGGIIGLHRSESGLLFAAGATPDATKINRRPVFAVTGGSSVPVGYLAGEERAIFAETEAILVAAGGDVILRVELDGFAYGDLSAEAPLATHVIANAQRLLANDVLVDRTKVRYSEQWQGAASYDGHEDWSAGLVANFFTAEARPDPVVAAHENTNEVFVFGSRTLQIFGSDPTLVFAPSAARELGCAAPYSVVKSDQSFFWLDNQRRFVMSDGRSHDVISGPIQRTLDEIADVTDCFGYRVKLGPIDVVAFAFPEDARTFVFQKGAGWAQWSGYDTSVANWQRFKVNAHVLADRTGTNIVGTTDGYLGELSFSSSTDLGDPIRAYIETGFENHETDKRKQCLGVRLAFRRGETADTPGPIALLRWRDEPGAWTGTCQIDLGASGDRHPVVRFHSLGVYRRRQWCFEFSGAEELVLLSAEEEYEVLD